MDPLIHFPTGARVPLSAIEKSHEARQSFLGEHHGNAGDVKCGCRSEPIPLGVGRRTSPQLIFYLYPLHRTDPIRHAIGCPFRGDPVVSEGEGEKPTPEPVEVKDGKLVLNLGAPNYEIDGERAAPAPSPGVPRQMPPARHKPATRRTSLQGLLEVLWTEAELNVWRPWFEGKRHYFTVRSRLLAAVEKVRLRNMDLGPQFYMPPPYREGREAVGQEEIDRFLAQLAMRPDGRRYFGYAAGVLRSVEASRRGGVVFHLAQTRQPLYMSGAEWGRAESHFGGVPVEEIGRTPRFVLLRVERVEGAKGPWLAVRELALLELTDTRNWIPAAGDAERQLAQKLIDEGRQIWKPLPFELLEGEPAPAFVLEDRADHAYLDLVDQADPVARVKLAEKRGKYQRAKQFVWWWNPANEPEIPVLPVADR